ncbi:radical SAM protein [Actinoallomurus rhizosphaericola]|uniref:radical SAM protein n=1 Tax=Actinoallomurus rhizosphaericola TaxID=2952536 RepID=UPI002092D659|nr:radical SAM protein [Actinoallomurus rhizosphaericola]MCO5999563.1 radical SAM protein [Actinoallomurus rhizosphaericola]
MTAEGVPIWDRFPSHQRLCINFTLTCNIACDHCIVESSPHRRERLDTDEVRAALSEAWENGRRHVTFSGGEVFLYPREMCEVITWARQLGYVVDVESNAFWARSDQLAREKLAPFVEAGISGLALSADIYHMKYFPVERPITAARTARSFGLATEIQFCRSHYRERDDEIIAALAAAGEPYVVLELLDRGRAREMLQVWRGHRVEELSECDDLTTTLHATGDVYACCQLDIGADQMKRTPVFLGSIRSAASGAAERDRREQLVRAFYDPESPIYFRTMVREHPLFQPLNEERFSNICTFCMHALGDPARVAALEERLRPAPTATS